MAILSYEKGIITLKLHYPPLYINHTNEGVMKITRQRILVTGSSGTIGTRLCESLLSKRYPFIGLDKRPNKWNDEINQVTIKANLLKPEDAKYFPQDIDIVIHLAANARVYNLVINPGLARENFEMLFNILEYCRIHDIKKILFASSREVYGNSGHTLYREEDALTENCESPYTASKIGGEALVHAYHKCYGIDYVITRFSNVYGMYDDSDRVIPLFIRQTLNNEDLTIYGKEKVLDFTYIDDTVDGILKCIEHFPEVKNSVFNFASGKSVPIIEIAKYIIQGMDGKNSIIFRKNRAGEVVRSSIDISKAQQKLGYSPKTQIHEGIRKTLVNYNVFRKTTR